MIEIMLMVVRIIKKITMNLLSLVPFCKWGDEKGVDVPLEGHWAKADFCRISYLANFQSEPQLWFNF